MSVGSSRHHGGNGGGGGHSSVWQLYRLPFAVLAFSIWICLYSLSSFVHLPEQLGLTQQCRMSRMWPAYIDHTQNLQPFSPSGLWRKYRLYLYRERNYDPMDLPSGSPALFVPGNAGSYAQIRSVASSAARQFYEVGGSGARKDEWKNAPVGKAHTDWYTVDFNEDFSAFSGSTIVEQATFLNEVLAYLRNRYASEPTRQYAAGERNTSVPILAHSMGGIAARLTQHLDNYLSDSVDTIVTLSTPHAYPPVPFDRSIERVYSRINDPATLPRSTSGAPPLIVSIAGGLLDTQLPSDPASVTLARLSETTPASRISTFTSSLPSLWSSVDHLAVMWCDQLREKIARAFLLDSMAFGRISAERTAGGVSGLGSELRKRRELWRRALSLFESADAGNADMGPVELIRDRQSIYDDDRQPYVVDSELASLNVPAQSILSSNETHWTYRVPAQVEGDVSVYTFELLTNLCIGGNPSSGMGPPIPQPVELVVMTCSGAPDPGNPTGGRRAACQVVLPWQWELIPPSFLPRTDLMAKPPQGSEVMPEDKSFPLADEIYHVPGLAYQRLRLDPVVLRRKQIDYIRIERRVAT
ncbi:PGAP1-domain-containing protein, partial [Testicularia cyperi]